MTLTEFLTARLDEDEDYNRLWLTHTTYPNTRGLREVAAKRKILALQAEAVSVQGDYHEDGSEYWTTRVLEALAAVWSDHPDYDPAWA